MIHAFEVETDGFLVEVFITEIGQDVWQRQLGRVGGHGWLVAIPLWEWSHYINAGVSSAEQAEYWVERLSSARTEDKQAIKAVAKAIASRY